MALISHSEAWTRLNKNAEELAAKSILDLFDEDPGRAARFSNEAAGLFVDYSKNKITPQTIEGLIDLADVAKLEQARAKMFAGEQINTTESRAVLHVALRDMSDQSLQLAGQNVSEDVRRERNKMSAFVAAVHQGEFTGMDGQVLDTVINIGIGGSDLGPVMATEALRPFWINGRRTFFVSNVDGQHLAAALKETTPERTLFVIASKTFTTQETMTNAQSARDWFLKNGGTEENIAKHFVALSTNEKAVSDFGIDRKNMFRFWDWVGGRYSLWSSIGLSIALQVGFENFEKLLQGAHAMDEHFRTAPMGENVPVLLALVGVWNRNFQNIRAHAVLPYDQHLSRLPAYLQQADMESNGKSVTIDGAYVDYSTGPVIFGEPGTNGQHAFYQLIHQGTDIISSDFIAAASTSRPLSDHHEKLLANFLAQPEALMRGKDLTDVTDELRATGLSSTEVKALAPHKVFPGDRPSTSILMERLTPETLGALICLYEHKIFCQGVLWGVNSFDQWGVELGKVLAKEILPEISKLGAKKSQVKTHDGSTNQLINKINQYRSQENG